MSSAPGWHKMFSEGRTLVGDEQRSGRPSATRTGDNAARVREFFDPNEDDQLKRLLIKWT
jgi:hypothetical protein